MYHQFLRKGDSEKDRETLRKELVELKLQREQLAKSYEKLKQKEQMLQKEETIIEDLADLFVNKKMIKSSKQNKLANMIKRASRMGMFDAEKIQVKKHQLVGNRKSQLFMDIEEDQLPKEEVNYGPGENKAEQYYSNYSVLNLYSDTEIQKGKVESSISTQSANPFNYKQEVIDNGNPYNAIHYRKVEENRENNRSHTIFNQNANGFQGSNTIFNQGINSNHYTPKISEFPESNTIFNQGVKASQNNKQQYNESALDASYYQPQQQVNNGQQGEPRKFHGVTLREIKPAKPQVHYSFTGILDKLGLNNLWQKRRARLTNTCLIVYEPKAHKIPKKVLNLRKNELDLIDDPEMRSLFYDLNVGDKSEFVLISDSYFYLPKWIIKIKAIKEIKIFAKDADEKTKTTWLNIRNYIEKPNAFDEHIFTKLVETVHKDTFSVLTDERAYVFRTWSFNLLWEWLMALSKIWKKHLVRQQERENY